MTYNNNFLTPILFLVFKRPDTTKMVFNIIKKIKPKYLYVAQDGPRENREGEKELYEEVRAIIKEIDWDCELKTLFRDKNLGCRAAISSAIDWFFENVDEGIILEDDCVPSLTFFPYCEELLNKYRDDDRVMTISGDASPFKNRFNNSEYSYFFSHYPLIWGWATWKRAWKNYGIDFKDWNNIKKDRNSFPTLKNKIIKSFWFMIFDKMFLYYEKNILLKNIFLFIIFGRRFIGRIDSWAYQWAYSSLLNGGLAIIPKNNLISNIGLGADSTHYKSGKDYRIEFPTKDIDFPLKHNVIDEVMIEKIDIIVEKNALYIYRHFIAMFFNRIKDSILQKLRFFKKDN